MTSTVPSDPLGPGVSSLSLSNIARAPTLIDPVFLDSPQYPVDGLSSLVGATVVVKLECLNPIGVFKGRGTSHLLATLVGDDPLVTASAGNFGQGLAYAARAHDRDVHVFAAETASPLKLQRMEELGARVHVRGRDFDDAKVHATAFADQEGARFVEDGREPAITEGAATIAVELEAADVDAIVAPVGNGALIAGIGRWMHAAAPGTTIVGVTALGAPAMRRSWEQDRPIEADEAATVADGIAVRVPVPAALEEMRHAVDAMVEVDDDAILEAGRLLLEHVRIVAEPAGAAALAGLLAAADRLEGQRVAVVVTGSNIDADRVRDWYGPRQA